MNEVVVKPGDGKNGSEMENTKHSEDNEHAAEAIDGVSEAAAIT